jgi:hypothetical protein
MMSLKEKLHNFVYLQRYKNRNASPAAKRWSRIKSSLLVAALIGMVVIYNNYQVQSVLELLRAPVLPELQTLNDSGKPMQQVWTSQNWGGSADKVSEETQRYHHISQGTSTLSMPYDWFMSLEEPESSLWTTLSKSLFFMQNEPLSDNDYLLRFGFIRGEKDPVNNPDGLPIGFAKTNSLNIAGLPVKTEGIGFTCAACHTGHLTHGKGDQAVEYIIEGGPATSDLGQLTAAISASLGQTALSSKIPFFDSRFDRFAKRVLGKQYNAEGKAALSIDLANLIEAAQKTVDIVDVQEGYGRLDALNRIGNQVFAKDMDRRENYQPINAPVNYPFIWTSSWFKWVQYDASIMQPLIRNAGEAMGVSAHVDMSAPKDEGKFQSSIPFDNLIWMESLLKGEEFNQGLRGPVWPFKPIDKNDEKTVLGKALYEKRCQGCHLPVVTNSTLSKYFEPIDYRENGQLKQTKEKVLNLNIIPQKEIGTDPAQGNVLASRMVNTAGNDQGTIEQRTTGIGLNGVVCGLDESQILRNKLNNTEHKVDLVNGLTIKDSGDLSFAFGLGAIVQQTIDAWLKENAITDPKLIEQLSGGRPNCLQAGRGYKARPLNGVWSTAPFLHNGSVATIRDLVCKTQDERPQYVQLGNISFDEENIGIAQPSEFQKSAKETIESGSLYTDEGYFILDSSIPGNSNRGHSFSDEYDESKAYNMQKKGVIGVKFTEQECNAILDYIKTI